MKSIMEEASSVSKAVEKAWIRAQKPQEFTVRIYEEPVTNFFGFTKKPAKIGLFFHEKTQDSHARDGARPHHRQQGDQRRRQSSYANPPSSDGLRRTGASSDKPADPAVAKSYGGQSRHSGQSPRPQRQHSQPSASGRSTTDQQNFTKPSSFGPRAATDTSASAQTGSAPHREPRRGDRPRHHDVSSDDEQKNQTPTSHSSAPHAGDQRDGQQQRSGNRKRFFRRRRLPGAQPAVSPESASSAPSPSDSFDKKDDAGS